MNIDEIIRTSVEGKPDAGAALASFLRRFGGTKAKSRTVTGYRCIASEKDVLTAFLTACGLVESEDYKLENSTFDNNLWVINWGNSPYTRKFFENLAAAKANHDDEYMVLTTGHSLYGGPGDGAGAKDPFAFGYGESVEHDPEISADAEDILPCSAPDVAGAVKSITKEDRIPDIGQIEEALGTELPLFSSSGTRFHWARVNCAVGRYMRPDEDIRPLAVAGGAPLRALTAAPSSLDGSHNPMHAYLSPRLSDIESMNRGGKTAFAYLSDCPVDFGDLRKIEFMSDDRALWGYIRSLLEKAFDCRAVILPESGISVWNYSDCQPQSPGLHVPDRDYSRWSDGPETPTISTHSTPMSDYSPTAFIRVRALLTNKEIRVPNMLTSLECFDAGCPVKLIAQDSAPAQRSIDDAFVSDADLAAEWFAITHSADDPEIAGYATAEQMLDDLDREDQNFLATRQKRSNNVKNFRKWAVSAQDRAIELCSTISNDSLNPTTISHSAATCPKFTPQGAFVAAVANALCGEGERDESESEAGNRRPHFSFSSSEKNTSLHGTDKIVTAVYSGVATSTSDALGDGWKPENDGFPRFDFFAEPDETSAKLFGGLLDALADHPTLMFKARANGVAPIRTLILETNVSWKWHMKHSPSAREKTTRLLKEAFAVNLINRLANPYTTSTYIEREPQDPVSYCHRDQMSAYFTKMGYMEDGTPPCRIAPGSTTRRSTDSIGVNNWANQLSVEACELPEDRTALIFRFCGTYASFAHAAFRYSMMLPPEGRQFAANHHIADSLVDPGIFIVPKPGSVSQDLVTNYVRKVMTVKPNVSSKHDLTVGTITPGLWHPAFCAGFTTAAQQSCRCTVDDTEESSVPDKWFTSVIDTLCETTAGEALGI